MDFRRIVQLIPAAPGTTRVFVDAEVRGAIVRCPVIAWAITTWEEEGEQIDQIEAVTMGFEGPSDPRIDADEDANTTVGYDYPGQEPGVSDLEWKARAEVVFDRLERSRQFFRQLAERQAKQSDERVPR